MNPAPTIGRCLDNFCQWEARGPFDPVVAHCREHAARAGHIVYVTCEIHPEKKEVANDPGSRKS